MLLLKAKPIIAGDRANARPTLRIGFTLVELLIAMTIMSSLVLLVLSAVRSARGDADRAKTRTTIGKIHQVLASQWQEYMTRPMPLKIPDRAFMRDTNGNQAVSSREMSRVRLIALRELMRLELPETPRDLFAPLPPVTIGLLEDQSDSLKRATDSYVITIAKRPSEFPAPPIFSTIINRVSLVSGWEVTNANAELLYLIVENSFIDGANAMELFRESEVADSDFDGLREFIDAWDEPIRFIRWPAGFRGVSGGPGQIFDLSSDFAMNGEYNLDPFDPLMADWGQDPIFAQSGSKPWVPGPGLFPLVISAGADRSFGIRFDLEGVSSHADIFWPIGSMPLPAAYTNNGPYYYPDPYHPRGANNVLLRQGTILDERQASDNVTNLDDTGGAL